MTGFPVNQSKPRWLGRSTAALLIALVPVAWASDGSLPPSRFLTQQAPSVPQAQKDAFDWEKPVVSRGLGGRTIVHEDEDDQLRQRYQSGQIAYFFGNHSQALAFWKPLAEQGFADAQASLGWLYQAGLGVERDLAQAHAWYLRAAEQGHAVAQNNLGVMYEKGQGVKADLQRAIAWYRRSAEQGYRFAQYNLATALRRAGEADADAIQRWLRAAAEQGVRQAAEALQAQAHP